MLELIDEESRVRVVTDRDEQRAGLDLVRLAGLRMPQPQAADVFVAEYLVDDVRRQEVDLVAGNGAVDHDLRGAELVAPVHERDPDPEARQEQRFLERGVAAADDVDVLFLEERAVAGRAGGHAVALQPLFRVEPEPAGARAGGDDHGLGAVLVLVHPDTERTLGEVDLRHVVGDELGAEAAGLVAEVLHHLRAHDAVLVARVILDVARDHQLPAPLEPLDHERVQVGACRVEGRGIAGGAAADDDQLTGLVFHRCSSKRFGPVGCS